MQAELACTHFLRCHFTRIHADLLPVEPEPLVLHHAVGHGEQRIVLGAHDVLARMPFRPALANQNIAGLDELAAKFLHAQSLCIAVAPVARRAHSFFMCHNCLNRDLWDYWDLWDKYPQMQSV
jgi:hypothetical protein